MFGAIRSSYVIVPTLSTKQLNRNQQPDCYRPKNFSPVTIHLEMIYLTDMELDAAKILEFYDFNKSSYNQMVEDMNLCHKGKYSRRLRREMFKSILESSTKQDEIMEYIAQKRNAANHDLASIMTEASVEKTLAEHNHYDDDAVKYWFYQLHPSFSASEIVERHEAAFLAISQREIDAYEHKDELRLHGEHWMEYHKFNLSDFEVEIARDLYRSMTEFMYDGLTARMCVKTLQNIYQDQTSARMMIDKKLDIDKSPIANDDLWEVLEKVRRKATFHTGSKNEENAFVKELFVQNWDDFTINEIKELAAKFYAEEVPSNGPVAEVRPEDVLVIESEDSDESTDSEDSDQLQITENIEISDESDVSFSPPPSKRSRIN